MNEETLERVYQENLEERIIAHLAKKCNFSYEKAMDLYYNSKLVLAQIVLETEKELLDLDLRA